jgi:hypothetical protein
MSILTNNISKSNLDKLQILSEIGLPLDIIKYCMKPYLENQIFVIIELQNPKTIFDLCPTVTTHKFTLPIFEELCNSKPTLIQQIINSKLATIKFGKGNYTYFTFHAGVNQFPLEYINNVKQIINTHDFDNLYDQINFNTLSLNNTSSN